MNKKIEKKQKELLVSQFEREKKKVRYDLSIIILDGQRSSVRNLEEISERLLNEFINSDILIKNLMDEIKNLMDEIKNLTDSEVLESEVSPSN